MRILAILAVVAILIVAVIIHFSDRDLGLTPIKSGTSSSSTQSQDSPSAASSSGSFAEVSNSLASDMQGIPTSLEAPGVSPRAAFNVKSRLAGVVSTRQEYQTLVRVCDLIIYAEQERSVRQSQAQQSQQNVSADLMAGAKAKQAQATAERSSIHDKAQADWESYRRQTAQEVSRLLGSLQNPRP